MIRKLLNNVDDIMNMVYNIVNKPVYLLGKLLKYMFSNNFITVY
ncbi:protein of unknown function [Petrocella atlantisensis]|uniref:Uncharacterized protein n=1 Tax=Petrocella atlantisensis TaxID=2173034 RepID=A0A3P7S2R3_9FIRM|nr:protein of unknown function [Petrocella atlantisensis]